MKKQTFIFVHDQNIIIDFENHGKFSNIENLIYVFCGNRPIDKLNNIKNVIIARDLEGNIEEFNSRLISFSGQYIIWKHGLVKADYVDMFEYDIILSEDFNEKQKECIEKNPKVIGYIPISINNGAFIKNKSWSGEMLESIKKNYNIDVESIINSMNEKSISITSNHTFEINHFNEYMKWIEPIIFDIKNNFFAGHQIERTIPIYYLIKNLHNEIITGVLHHFQFDSHKTQGISESKFINNYDKLINNK